MLLLTLSTKSFSQTTDSLTGSKGFYLNIGGNYNVALKYWLSSKTAVVVGVGIYGNVYNIGAQGGQQPPVNTNALVFGRFHYFLTERRQFMPYFSAGGSIGNQWSWSSNFQTTSLSLGLASGVGMECFILPWLTISGELGLSATYSGFRQEFTSTPSNQSLANWSYGFGHSGIIFTIYF
jgi:hypothetical protein